eukprot:Gb_04992 [translate_table: standard]
MDGGEVLLSKEFLKKCIDWYSVFPKGKDCQSRSFSLKYLNVVDPLRENNNLGRSVSKGNFCRIRSAFGYGARKLGKILQSPKKKIAEELDNFFLNTWDRHGSGERQDVPDSISCGLESKWPVESASFVAIPNSIVENQDTKEIAYAEGTKVQSTETAHQVNNSISESARLQKMFCPSSVEGWDRMTDGADLKINLPFETKKDVKLSVDVYSTSVGDWHTVANPAKSLAGKDEGQCSETHVSSNKQCNQSSSSRSVLPRGDVVTGVRLAGDAKDLTSDKHLGYAISTRKSTVPSSKQRSSTEGNKNDRGKSESNTGSVSTSSKLYSSPPTAEKGLIGEGNVNNEFARKKTCNEATVGSYSNIQADSGGQNCHFTSNIKQEAIGNDASTGHEHLDANRKSASSKTPETNVSLSYIQATLPLPNSSHVPSCLPVSVEASHSGALSPARPPPLLMVPSGNSSSASPDSCMSSGFDAHDTTFLVARGPLPPPSPHCLFPLGSSSVGIVDKATQSSASFQSQLAVESQQHQHTDALPEQQNYLNVRNSPPLVVSTATVVPVVQLLSGVSLFSQSASNQMGNFSNSDESKTALESNSSSVEHGILESDRMKKGLLDLSKHVTSFPKTSKASEQRKYAGEMSTWENGFKGKDKSNANNTKAVRHDNRHYSISTRNVFRNENGEILTPGFSSSTEQDSVSEVNEYPQNFSPNSAVQANPIPFVPPQNFGTPFLVPRSDGPVLAGYNPIPLTYRAPEAMLPPSSSGKQASSFSVGVSLVGDTSKSLQSQANEISSVGLNPIQLPTATESATSNPYFFNSADFSFPSFDMYNSLYPIQPNSEAGVVSCRSSGRSIENANEVSRVESLKEQQASAVHREKIEDAYSAAIPGPQLESMTVGPVADGLSSPRYDLLSGDFGSHLDNLAYGRWCQDPVLHGSILPFPVLPAQYVQEHCPWEGPGRPFHPNMNVQLHIHGHGFVPGHPFFHASCYLGTNSPILPGTFPGEEIPKSRSGTGTYFPNMSHRSYRERNSPNKGRRQQGTPAHDLTAREASAHQYNSRKQTIYDSVPHWPTGHVNLDSKPAEGKFGVHDLSRHEALCKSLYQSSSPAVKGNTVLASPGGSMYSSSHVSGQETPSAYTAVSPSGPPVVMLYPYSNGLTFPSEQLEFGSFGPVQYGAIPRMRAEQGGHIGSVMMSEQSYAAGSTSPSPFSSERGLQQPSAPSKQESAASQSYQLKEEDFPPLSFQGQHRGSSPGAGNEHAANDRGPHCQAFVTTPLS